MRFRTAILVMGVGTVIFLLFAHGLVQLIRLVVNQ